MPRRAGGLGGRAPQHVVKQPFREAKSAEQRSCVRNEHNFVVRAFSQIKKKCRIGGNVLGVWGRSPQQAEIAGDKG